MIVQILVYLALSLAWIEAEPLIYFKRIVFKEENYYTYSKTKQFFHRLVYCLYCSSFWITLLFTLNISSALIVSLLAFLLDNYKNKSL